MNTYVFDLDNILLNRNKAVGEDTQHELLNRSEQGDTIFFATSRPIRTIRRFIDRELLSVAHVISLNGAILHEANGNMSRFSYIGDRVPPLLSDPIILERVHFSIELLGEAFGTNAIYTDEELDKFQSATREMVLPVDEIELNLISKVAVDGLGKNISDLLPKLEQMDLYPIPCMDEKFINVVDPSVDKSVTLNKALETTQNVLSSIYVFGDDIPDIRMMKFGTKSVAMANAKAEVKDVADYVIGDCDDDSIGEFIRNVC